MLQLIFMSERIYLLIDNIVNKLMKNVNNKYFLKLTIKIKLTIKKKLTSDNKNIKFKKI